MPAGVLGSWVRRLIAFEARRPWVVAEEVAAGAGAAQKPGSEVAVLDRASVPEGRSFCMHLDRTLRAEGAVALASHQESLADRCLYGLDKDVIPSDCPDSSAEEPQQQPERPPRPSCLALAACESPSLAVGMENL